MVNLISPAMPGNIIRNSTRFGNVVIQSLGEMANTSLAND
jgi:hypothetical protein